MSQAQSFWGSFYARMGLAFLALIFLGFTPFVYERFGSGGTMSPALMLHTASYLGWFLLFPYQASLVAGRNIKRHMALGKASLGLAAIMAVSSVLVTIEVYARHSSGNTPFTPEHFIILPLMDMWLFPIFYTLGFLNRKKGEAHKHYMLFAGLMILDPATGRLGLMLGFPPIALLFHFGLLAIVWMRDRRTLGAAHTATRLATGLLVLRYVLFFGLGPTEAWANFVHKLFG